MKIIQVSDFHFTKDTNLDLSRRKIDKLYAIISEHINRDEIIIFCTCGDVIDAKERDGYNSAKNVFDYIKEKFRQCKFFFEFVPGNHDLLDNKFDAYDRFIGNFIEFEPYEYSKKDVIIRHYEDVNLILVNSIHHRKHEYGSIEIEQLRRALGESEKESLIVLHHTIMSRYSEDDSPIRNSYEFIDEISCRDVIGFLHGHTHGYSDFAIGGNCKVIGVGPLFKPVQDVPNQFNLIELISGEVDKVINFGYRADTNSFEPKDVFERKNKSFFTGSNLPKMYKKIVSSTKAYRVLNNFHMCYSSRIDAFNQEIERNFGEQIPIAEQWQAKECPPTLYYNHGSIMDKGGGIEYVCKELMRKSTSSRALLSLVNVEDVKKSEDSFLPSFDIIQFGFHNESKTDLNVTLYLRALEVNHFLKINLCEIYLMITELNKRIRSIRNVTINIFAFRTQFLENFGCFQKAAIDMIDENELTLMLNACEYSEVVNLLRNKLEMWETVIKDDGINKLYRGIISVKKRNPDLYEDRIIESIEILKNKYHDLKELKKSTSVYSEVEQEEAEIVELMYSLIQDFENIKGRT